MIIGIDFDNTMVCYDSLFHRLTLERKWISDAVPPAKDKVRDHLRARGMEEQWIELQGEVYGPKMKEASLFPGVLDFIRRCHEEHVTLYIISHRTQYPFRGTRHDLHAAAYEWLEAQGFFALKKWNLSRDQVFFELTKEEKLERIKEKRCGYFVDDLPEFLSEPSFPSHAKRILFDPNYKSQPDTKFACVHSWHELEEIIPWNQKISV